LLVSIVLFSVAGLSMVSVATSSLRTMTAESKSSLAGLQLRNALDLLSSELRASSAISPYLTGYDPTAVNCRGQVSVSSTSVRFLVVEDDSTATTTSGIKPYYVGYSFNAATGELLRGEIAASSVTSCSVPAGNPSAAPTARLLAKNVVRVDNDGNGSLDSPFSISGDTLTVSLGIETDPHGDRAVNQDFTTKILLRTHL
jgi:hypothetical protein